MLPYLLGLIGLAIGFALDAAIVRLAVAAEDEGDEPAEGLAPADRPEAGEPRPSVHAEAGSLVLPLEGGEWAWARRLLVVGATAGLFATAGARYDGPAELTLVAAYICVFLVCAGTDLLAYRVPNVVTYPAIILALVAGLAMPDANLAAAVGGGALAGGVLLLPSLFTGGAGMGMGDVKLVAFAGLALGFFHIVAAMVLMSVAGGVVAVLLMLTRIRGRGEPIPYAPFISAGALATLLWQGSAFATLP